jgi:glycosyltransferase involved in cell wall biosynthesis
MSPLVSIILPTFNRAATLGRAVESVFEQTFEDWELIIVDDRSSDETERVLAAYAGHEKVRLISQLQSGCAVARNLGVSVSRGRYLAFQDSDDEWTSDKLARAVAALDGTGPEVGLCYSDMLRVQTDGSIVYFGAPDVHRQKIISEETLDFLALGIGIQAAVIKRECFERVGLFDEALPRFIDLDLFIRLSEHFDFIHQREPLVSYYACEGISTNTQALVIARRHLLKKYRARLEREKTHLAKQHLQLARAYYENGARLAPVWLALKALLLCRLEFGLCKDAFQILGLMMPQVFVKWIPALYRFWRRTARQSFLSGSKKERGQRCSKLDVGLEP